MKLLPLSLLCLTVMSLCFLVTGAQTRRSNFAIVIDEDLSLLRVKPSLLADSIQRMRLGRRVQILGSFENEGVRFLKVSAPPRWGWIQADALAGKFRPNDEERFARVVQAADGFDRIELASIFLTMYPTSRLRPAMLLLFGDLLEETATKLSRDAKSRLSSRVVAASGAPLHSYYLNFRMLDRYRKLGVTFLFDPTTRAFHYNGASWYEITRKYPRTAEATEARKRLESLRGKMPAQ
jgi:hypothetical protein